MNDQFDYERFEKLSGFELAMYYSKWVQENAVGIDFVEYFRNMAGKFDDEHLEIALAMIQKTSSKAAFYEIAKFMRHPNASVRLFAVNTISHLPSIDDLIMQLVVSTLTNPVDSLGILELKEALKRPANNQARVIAEEYLKKLETT
jgi:hypothetical protein